jgi:hypothetical protein
MVELSLGTASSMKSATLLNVANEQVLYLTTIGRLSGLPREIEIWFVVCSVLFTY